MNSRFRSLLLLFVLMSLGVSETASAQSWFRQRTYDRHTAPVQPASSAERQVADALVRRYASKMPTPVAEAISASGLPLAIPDDGPAITSRISIAPGEAVTALAVSVSIAHQARGDLRVRLISPGGETYTLADESGGKDDDLVLTERTVAIPASGTIHGTWTLSVQDRDERSTGRLVSWTMHVTRIESAVIDLTMSLESTPDADTRLVYERIVGHFADAMYEMTNGAHRVGQVRIFTGGRNFGTADIRWGLRGTPHVPRNGGVGVAGGHIMMYETFTRAVLEPGDTVSSWWSMHLLKEEVGAGYTMAHEWGHYFLGLYDESAPHTCGAKDEVKGSIMANQWKATEGNDRFDWLNLSIARSKGGDFEIERSTCQYFAYSDGAWPVLARTPDEDPRDGTSMKFQTLGPRIFYPELALVAPGGTTRRRLDLPSPMARASLKIVWMASRTVLDIVLDRSGSMAGPKLAKAKAAAKLLVDQAVVGETSIGLTVFDHTVTDLLSITDLDSDDVRAKIKSIIDDVVTAGTTAIGDAAAKALDKMRARTDDAETRVVFLLTDGQSNAGRDTDTVVAGYTEARIPLFTFGFGVDVDEKALSALAAATGGRYYTSPTTLTALTTAFREATQIAVSSAGAGSGELSPTPSRPAMRMLAVDAAMSRLQVAVVVPVGASTGQVQLLSPAGIAVAATTTSMAGGETVVLFDVADPADGAWQIAATATSGTPVFSYGVTAVQASVGYSVSTGVRGGGFTVATAGPVVIESRLTRRRAIAGADVSALVMSPSGVAATLVMNDRGAFPDVTAGDGHYAGLFEPTGAGVYRVAVEFTNPRGQAYETYAGAMLTPGAGAVDADEVIAEGFVRSETVHVTVTTEATTAAPRVLLAPASVEIAAGRTAEFTIGALASPAPTFQWQRRRVGTLAWTDVQDGGDAGVRISGATTQTLRLEGVQVQWFGDEFRVRVSNAVGRVESDRATLRQAAGSVAVDRRALVFVIERRTNAVTPAQAVTLLAAGQPAPSWTVSTSAAWLQISTTSGVGSRALRVAVAPAGLDAATVGRVTITPEDPTAPTQVIDVSVIIRESDVGQAPFGQVDTPAQDAVGAQGAIGVTGWVLDDIGVQRIAVYRQCLPIDVAASCQTVLGESLVWLGDALPLPGARPDVEVVYPTAPARQTAGWGFLVMSNLLPHIPRGSVEGGGQGTFLFHVIATDVEGQSVRLGRTINDQAPTVVQVDNDTLAKPFGTIDTPRPGETVAGVVANFGWALTPDRNTAADAEDVALPVTGSTITVFVDSLPVGLVTYDQCRGTVDLTQTASAYCDDDIASIFGHRAPQAAFSARVANPTRFRNLDAGRGAIGAFLLDTTTMTNGLHTIAWSVTDSLGRTEGVGSRFFTVLNPTAPVADGSTVSARPAAARAARRAASPPLAVLGRTGFDLASPFTAMRADDAGVYHVRLPEFGRLELQFSAAIDGAALEAGDGALRPLPVGARVDGTQFGWMPPVGYVGVYRMSFMVGCARVIVAVTVAPVTREPEGASEVTMALTAATVLAEGRVRVTGSASDPQASIGAGIGAVHVWARSLTAQPGTTAEPMFLGAATVGLDRSGTGFQLEASLPVGTYELTAYVWSTRTGRFEDARSVVVIVR